MESFVLDLSMSGDCGVTNSQGIEPFSYFGYLFFTTPIGLPPMDTVYENTANYCVFFIGLLITSVKLNLKRIPPRSYFNKTKKEINPYYAIGLTPMDSVIVGYLCRQI